MWIVTPAARQSNPLPSAMAVTCWSWGDEPDDTAAAERVPAEEAAVASVVVVVAGTAVVVVSSTAVAVVCSTGAVLVVVSSVAGVVVVGEASAVTGAAPANRGPPPAVTIGASPAA